jgi:hypothetical protein
MKKKEKEKKKKGAGVGDRGALCVLKTGRDCQVSFKKKKIHQQSFRKRNKGRGITTLINGNTDRDVIWKDQTKKRERRRGAGERERGVYV